MYWQKLFEFNFVILVLLQFVKEVWLATGVNENYYLSTNTGRYIPQLHGGNRGKYMPDDSGKYRHKVVPYNGGYGDRGLKYKHDIRNIFRQQPREPLPPEQSGEETTFENTLRNFISGLPGVPFALGPDDHLRFSIDFNHDGSGWQIIEFHWIRDNDELRRYNYFSKNKLWEEEADGNFNDSDREAAQENSLQVEMKNEVEAEVNNEAEMKTENKLKAEVEFQTEKNKNEEESEAELDEYTVANVETSSEVSADISIEKSIDVNINENNDQYLDSNVDGIVQTSTEVNTEEMNEGETESAKVDVKQSNEVEPSGIHVVGKYNSFTVYSNVNEEKYSDVNDIRAIIKEVLEYIKNNILPTLT